MGLGRQGEGKDKYLNMPVHPLSPPSLAPRLRQRTEGISPFPLGSLRENIGLPSPCGLVSLGAQPAVAFSLKALAMEAAVGIVERASGRKESKDMACPHLIAGINPQYHGDTPWKLQIPLCVLRGGRGLQRKRVSELKAIPVKLPALHLYAGET